MKVEKFLKKKNWCKGSYAKNSKGMRIDYHDPDARSFCLFGAILRCYGEIGSLDAQDTPAAVAYKKVQDVIYKERAVNKLKSISIAEFNDHPETTFTDIQQVIKLAKI